MKRHYDPMVLVRGYERVRILLTGGPSTIRGDLLTVPLLVLYMLCKVLSRRQFRNWHHHTLVPLKQRSQTYEDDPDA